MQALDDALTFSANPARPTNRPIPACASFSTEPSSPASSSKSWIGGIEGIPHEVFTALVPTATSLGGMAPDRPPDIVMEAYEAVVAGPGRTTRRRPSTTNPNPFFRGRGSRVDKMAERAGFEPAMGVEPHTRLAGECLQPLGHLSLRLSLGSVERRAGARWRRAAARRRLAVRSGRASGAAPGYPAGRRTASMSDGHARPEPRRAARRGCRGGGPATHLWTPHRRGAAGALAAPQGKPISRPDAAA
jgi:hypothetical protein